MNSISIKQSLHELIEEIEDLELLNLHLQLLKKEVQQDLFNTNENDMIQRAEKALKSVQNGHTRSIQSFKKDVHSWKKGRATQ